VIKVSFDSAKKRSATSAEVVFFPADHGLKIDVTKVPHSIFYDGVTLVKFRPSSRGVNMVILLEVDSMINDGWYRSMVRSLLGWRFYRKVRSTIMFQRRHGGGYYSPLIKPAWKKAPVERVIAAEQSPGRHVPASELSDQPATI
jgi:hypothetical protein